MVPSAPTPRPDLRARHGEIARHHGRGFRSRERHPRGSLHNHFSFDEPKVYFLHIGRFGRGGRPHAGRSKRVGWTLLRGPPPGPLRTARETLASHTALTAQSPVLRRAATGPAPVGPGVQCAPAGDGPWGRLPRRRTSASELPEIATILVYLPALHSLKRSTPYRVTPAMRLRPLALRDRPRSDAQAAAHTHLLRRNRTGMHEMTAIGDAHCGIKFIRVASKV